MGRPVIAGFDVPPGTKYQRGNTHMKNKEAQPAIETETIQPSLINRIFQNKWVFLIALAMLLLAIVLFLDALIIFYQALVKFISAMTTAFVGLFDTLMGSAAALLGAIIILIIMFWIVKKIFSARKK
ncbi:MAG: hypothetical protein HQK57_02955 [Deltaproteobacteria bacterium]|nr:hypothetical protein [Deltaproteobacteria bacterium]